MSGSTFTVLFATRNGERVLPRTLEGYCRTEKPPQRWKMVIVDNGSDDRTADILAAFGKRLPLEALQQSTPGKNSALNLGLGALEGRLAIITDDDAIPDPTFLMAWSCYLNMHEDYQLLGGSIVPLFETPPPRWMVQSNRQCGMLFATRDLPEGPIPPNEIYGPNMAVRRSVFEDGFRFNENIGPNASDPNYPMGSETEFCCRVARNGGRAWFAKQPCVQHIIRSGQLAKSYWAQRSYRHGRGFAKLMLESGDVAPPTKLRRFIAGPILRLRYRAQMFSPFPLQRFDGLCDYYWTRGCQDEWANKSKT